MDVVKSCHWLTALAKLMPADGCIYAKSSHKLHLQTPTRALLINVQTVAHLDYCTAAGVPGCAAEASNLTLPDPHDAWGCCQQAALLPIRGELRSDPA